MIAQKLALIEHFLVRRGIALQITRQPLLDVGEIAEAERILGHSIPGDLRDIYLRFANGFEVFWEDVQSQTDFDFARFSLPDVRRFVQDSLRFREETREQYANREKYFERPEQAQFVLHRML